MSGDFCAENILEYYISQEAIDRFTVDSILIVLTYSYISIIFVFNKSIEPVFECLHGEICFGKSIPWLGER
jgi:hypothetical protein